MRNRHFLLLDLPAMAIAAYGAFVLRFDWLFAQERHEFVPYVIAAMVIKPLVFYGFGIYARYWQYASVADMTAVFLAVSASSVTIAVTVGLGQLAGISSGFPRSVILIDWLLTLVLISISRASIRVISDQRSRNQKSSASGDRTKPNKRVLIVGAGVAGSMVAREMRQNPHLRMTPIGYLDDDPKKVGKRVQGVPVLRDTAALDEVVKVQQIDEVVIAMPRAPGAVVRTLVDMCRRAGVSSRAMPGVFELLDGVVSVNRLRNIDIADLLRRRQIVGIGKASSYVTERTVLITGAGGSIGYELCRQAAFAHPARVVLLGHGENSIFEALSRLTATFPNVAFSPVIADIRDRARILRVFRQFRPDVVFHAAAHKHVPLMEENPTEAITNNVLGTANVVNAALESGAERFVLVSTDKAVSPSSIMGASKRLAEIIVREAARPSGRAFVVVRFGNVLGSRGSVVQIFKRQIEHGGPITVTHPNMKRFFMTIPEAVHLVMEAGGLGIGGELFVLNMGEPVRIVDLVADLVRLSGLEAGGIPITYTGMRPGEKMEESLWEDGAVVERTANPDLLKVTERGEPPRVDLAGLLRLLEAAAERGESNEIAALIADCVHARVPPVHSPSILRRV